MMHLFSTSLLVGTFLTSSYADALRRSPAYNLRPALPELKTAQPDPLTIQIPIDHSNNGTGMYTNRYWINSTYYQAGGPVFLFDAGEQTVTDDFVQFILMEASVPSAVMRLAEKYNGLAVLLEHRFYGESLPFPINETTGLAPDGYDAYQYLTIEQALEDVVYLAEHFQPTGLESSWSALQPSQVPWVFLGGSYPGNRAAWIRIRNPDIIYASWASSAPVQTSVEMPTYYTQMYSDMTANCSADMAMASEYVTQVMTSGDAADRTIVTLIGNLVQKPDYIDEVIGLTDLAIESESKETNTTDFVAAFHVAKFVTAGVQTLGFNAALLPYCTLIERFDPSEIDNSSISNVIQTTFENSLDRRPAVQSIGARYGPQAAFLAVMYGIYAQTITALKSNETQSPHALSDGQSWAWQTCIDLGYFQTASPGSAQNLLSDFINATAWQQEICQGTFDYPQLPSIPNTKALVDKYGGWNMNPSQVMFTNGLKDPWHTLSVQSTSTEIGAPNRKTTQTVPECGKGADGTDVFGMTFPEAYHVSDLSGEGQSDIAALALFEQALDKWLPCFQKHSITSNTTSSTKPATTSSSGSSTASTSASKTGGADVLKLSRDLQLGIIAALLGISYVL